MLKKKKSKKEKISTSSVEEPILNTKDVDEPVFGIKAATVTTVNVPGVSGTSNYGTDTIYTANVITVLSEASATINVVLSSMKTLAGQSLKLSDATLASLPVTATVGYLTGTAATETTVIPWITATAAQETSLFSTTTAGTYSVTGDLTLITPTSTLAYQSLTITISSPTQFVFTDNGAGILSANSISLNSLSGVVDYTNGEYTLDFNAAGGAYALVTSGTPISADYQYVYSQPGRYSLTGNLSFITAASSVQPGTVSIDISSGGYTFTDDGAGILTESSGLTGTINNTTGNWTVDFNTGASAVDVIRATTQVTEDYKYRYYWNRLNTPIYIVHTVTDNSVVSGTITGRLSAVVADPITTASTVSNIFTLSANSVSTNNPWYGRGALPGETAQETRSRFYVEGII